MPSKPNASEYRPYFPMLMGNGDDYVLLGYAGTIGACDGHEHYCYDQAVQAGWCKSDLRAATKYGQLADILRAGYFILDGMHVQAMTRPLEQSFDPGRGALHSRNRHGDSVVRVESVMAREHLLVHRFDITPSQKGLRFQFFVGAPAYWIVAARGQADVAFRELDAKGPPRRVEFETRVVGQRCKGYVVSDRADARRVACYNGASGLEIPLNGRTRFSVALSCAWRRDMRRIALPPARAATSLSEIVREDAASWRRYDRMSSITTGDPRINELYRTSLYALRAHQYPNGAVPGGGYPLMWFGQVDAFDLSFDHMAFLGANRIEEAEKVVAFWQGHLPRLRRVTAELGLPGVYCHTHVSAAGKDVVPPEGTRAERRAEVLETKHFHSADVVLQAWQLYRYTGRADLLKKYWDCMAQPMEFLLGACVVEHLRHAEIVRSSGPNGKERRNGKIIYLPNPTRTLGMVIEALKAIRQAADILGRPRREQWDRLLPKLERGLRVNMFDGLLRANRARRSALGSNYHTISLYETFAHGPTLDAELAECLNPETGDVVWPHQGYLAVPWSSFSVAGALLRMGRPGAARLVQRAARWTTTLGAFPEAVRPDGAYWKTWYPTVHAAFAHVLHLMMLRPRADGFDLFADVPPEWGDVSFERLRVPPGILVSARRSGGRVACRLTNDSPNAQTIRLGVGLSPSRRRTVELRARETTATLFLKP